ncbi:hypothetical protein VTN02DRAFT_6386 [Thermoascus thermophilus]
MPKISALALVTSLLAALPVDAGGLYTKSSPVLQVDQKSYDQLIAKSNHTSIVEFYAPWCGHCQNLKPAYEKAAKNLEGLAKVAAVNCDDDSNKPLCSRMGVQGFPTLKIMTPSKKPGKPRVEDYQGPRSAKAIVDAVVERIPNHVKKLTDKDLDAWLSEDEDAPKAILFTEKGTTSALIRALAIDFLGSIRFAQVRRKESGAVEKFGIERFPTFVLLPGGGAEKAEQQIVYEGELKKKPMTEFLSQVAQPNPDPAPTDSKTKSKSSSKKSAKPSQTSITLDDEIAQPKPTKSPDPKIVPDDARESKPVQVPIHAPPLDILSTTESLESTCLTPRSGTCILALIPPPPEPDAEIPSPAKEALASLSEIAHRLAQRQGQGQGKIFPIYNVPGINPGAKMLRDALGLSEDAVELVALNGRRGWWKRYEEAEKGEFGLAKVEAWVDAIRLGETKKEKLPEGVVVPDDEEGQAEKKREDHDEL